MKPDFPSLADDRAVPRPDMNIKVAAFTVSEMSIYTSMLVPCSYLVLQDHKMVDRKDNSLPLLLYCSTGSPM